MKKNTKQLLLLGFLFLYSGCLNAETYRINTAETSEELSGIYGIEYNYNNTTKVMGMLSSSVFVTNKINNKYDTTNKTLYTKPYNYTFESKIKFFKTILGTPAVAGKYRYYYSNSSSDTYLSESTYLFNNAANEFFEVRNFRNSDIYDDVEQEPKNKRFFCMKNSTYEGRVYVDVYAYNSSSEYISYGGVIEDNTFGSYHAGKKLIVLDYSKFILITNKAIRLYKFNEITDRNYSNTTLIAETLLPNVSANIYEWNVEVNSVVALPDGTYSFVIDYEKNTLIVHIDATTKIKNVIYLGNTYYSENININGGGTSMSAKGSNFVQSCHKNGDTIIYFGGYNNSPAIYEVNLSTGKFEASNVDIPFYKNNNYYGPVDIRYINKKIYVNLGFIQRVYSSRPVLRSGLVVYEPVPPTVTISTPYANIGDNTSIAVNVSASKEYPILCIFNENTQQAVYWGTPNKSVNYNWDGMGDITLTARLHDSDGAFLSKSNAITVNQKKMLNYIIDTSSSNNGAQRVVILVDTDRYYENTIANQLLVSKLKANKPGMFLISNNVSPVLFPLLS